MRTNWSSSPGWYRTDFYIVIALIAWLYFGVAHIRYRFAHPELTETQLFLHTFDVLCWR
jgi:hypothetical protein